MPSMLVTPATAKEPLPVMVELTFVFPPGSNLPMDTSEKAPPSWQQEVYKKAAATTQE
jgi:hypothetical protein